MNKPAFPTKIDPQTFGILFPDEPCTVESVQKYESGLSKLEYAAIQISTACAVRLSSVTSVEDVAKKSVELAKALLAELEKEE